MDKRIFRPVVSRVVLAFIRLIMPRRVTLAINVTHVHDCLKQKKEHQRIDKLNVMIVHSRFTSFIVTSKTKKIEQDTALVTKDAVVCFFIIILAALLF